ncbi:hypothetical protein JW824_13530 [bacterium]|nr:hypothetical protein [bacterium]
MKKNINCYTYILICTLILIMYSKNGYTQDERTILSKGFYITVMTSSINRPIFRQPGGSEEISIHQKKGTWSATAGLEYIVKLESFGLGGGIAFSYWKTDFDNFGFRDDFTGSVTSYSNVKYRVFFFDFIIHILPISKLPLSFYGFLGMGSKNEKYDLSGAVFSEWDGSKSISEFSYSYGLGIRLFAIRHFSLFIEYRFIPGDVSSDLDYLYTKDGWNYYAVGHGEIKNFAKILSFGLAFSF